jgi:hypothetical protein
MNTTAGGFPSINAPSGSTATVTATDWTAEVATSGASLRVGDVIVHNLGCNLHRERIAILRPGCPGSGASPHEPRVGRSV